MKVNAHQVRNRVQTFCPSSSTFFSNFMELSGIEPLGC